MRIQLAEYYSHYRYSDDQIDFWLPTLLLDWNIGSEREIGHCEQMSQFSVYLHSVGKPVKMLMVTINTANKQIILISIKLFNFKWCFHNLELSIFCALTFRSTSFEASGNVAKISLPIISEFKWVNWLIPPWNHQKRTDDFRGNRS